MDILQRTTIKKQLRWFIVAPSRTLACVLLGSPEVRTGYRWERDKNNGAAVGTVPLRLPGRPFRGRLITSYEPISTITKREESATTTKCVSDLAYPVGNRLQIRLEVLTQGSKCIEDVRRVRLINLS